MRTPVLVLVCLLSLLGHAAADEKKAKEEPAQKTEQVADAVLAAVKAKRDKALAGLAQKDKPDPWLVADELCYRGEHDAAVAYAEAAPRKAVEKLPVYVASRRGKQPDEKARKAVVAMYQALRKQEWHRALDAARGVSGALDSIVHIRIAYGRGVALRETNRRAESAIALTRVGEVLQDLGWLTQAATSFQQAGLSAYRASDWKRAALAWEARLRIDRALGNQSGIADMLNNLGMLQQGQGNYPEALRRHEESLKIVRALGNQTGIAGALNNIGIVQQNLGDHPEALRRYKEALEIRRARGDQRGVAGTLNNIGQTQQSLGNYTEALRHYAESLKIKRALGDQARVADTLHNIGTVEQSLGDHAAALRHYDESLKIRRTLGIKTRIAGTLNNIGLSQTMLGRYAAAHETYERALRILNKTPNRDTQARVRWGVARLYLRQDRPGDAVASARKGVQLVADLFTGLAEGEGAGARDLFSGLFDTGSRAALRARQSEDLLWFLEQGRAGALREALGSRSALEAAVIPVDLRKALTLARQGERRALQAYRRATHGNISEATRAASVAWEEAQAEVERVSARVQREAKAAASIVLAKTDALDAIRGYLRPGEALVLYGLTYEEGFALVVEPNGSRTVTLDASKTLGSKAAQLLRLGERPGTRGLILESSQSLVDTVQAAATLRRLLVEPLDLGAHVKRVLVSPTGPLGYIPLAMLLPDREVVYVPSGTTYGLLLSERDNRGDGILGVGNPDYKTVVNKTGVGVHRGAAQGALSALPGTLKEVEGIGGVPLLGKGATESGMRSAIKRRVRWRSVHFACHGLVNAERPMLSALAITADSEDDGFVTALEILGMKVPADLVVMSACETGKGKIYKTEGIVGLTRAFMFAGAPRVICSLWKVDDEATQALMIKFYELWNPKDASTGLGAGAALKQAQEFIEGHEKWKHPYYWAAWVLWGLPD